MRYRLDVGTLWDQNLQCFVEKLVRVPNEDSLDLFALDCKQFSVSCLFLFALMNTFGGSMLEIL